MARKCRKGNRVWKYNRNGKYVSKRTTIGKKVKRVLLIPIFYFAFTTTLPAFEIVSEAPAFPSHGWQAREEPLLDGDYRLGIYRRYSQDQGQKGEEMYLLDYPQPIYRLLGTGLYYAFSEDDSGRVKNWIHVLPQELISLKVRRQVDRRGRLRGAWAIIRLHDQETVTAIARFFPHNREKKRKIGETALAAAR